MTGKDTARVEVDDIALFKVFVFVLSLRVFIVYALEATQNFSCCCHHFHGRAVMPPARHTKFSAHCMDRCQVLMS